MKTLQEFVLKDQIMVLSMLPFSGFKKERNSALKCLGFFFFFFLRKKIEKQALTLDTK